MTPEVPGAIAVPADSTNYGARPRPILKNGYRRIVIHCTSGRADPMGPASMWQQPHAGSSAHFVVGQDGTVVQCVELCFAAYHAHSANADSIGVEHCARAAGTLSAADPGLPPSDACYRSSAKLVAYLLVAAGVQPDRSTTVLGHAEADPQTTHTLCPVGDGWNWETYWPLLIQEYIALTTAGVLSNS